MESQLLYFHGAICREEAEVLLKEVNKTGAFLIRHSETLKGSFTLCLWANDGYHQYRIINDAGYYYIKAEIGVEETKYSSLAQLIESYQNRDSSNGLAAPLKYSIPRKSEEDSGFYDLKKNTSSNHNNSSSSSNQSEEVNESIACFIQDKFRRQLQSSKLSTSNESCPCEFTDLIENYLESGLATDLHKISSQEDMKPIEDDLLFSVLLEETIKPILQSTLESLDKLQLLNQLFSSCQSPENSLFDNATINTIHQELLYNCQQPLSHQQQVIAQCVDWLQQAQCSTMSKFFSYLSNSLQLSSSNTFIQNRSNQNNFNNTNSSSTNKPINGYYKKSISVQHNRRVSEEFYPLKPISFIKTFELESPLSGMLDDSQLTFTVIVDIVTGTLKFIMKQLTCQSSNGSTSNITCENVIDCETVMGIRQNTNQTNQLYLELDGSNNFNSLILNFKYGHNVRSQFIDCVVGAKKFRHISRGLSNTADSCIIDNLSVFIGTWNIANNLTVDNFSHWLKCIGNGTTANENVVKYVPFDIYVVAFQECHADQYWDSLIASTISSCYNREFQLLATKHNTMPKTLVLSVFCRSELKKHFKNINCDFINTGFVNKCGNKGAVSISFAFQDTSFCFINCHLASGLEKIQKREEEFRLILEKLHSSSLNTHSNIINSHMGNVNSSSNGSSNSSECSSPRDSYQHVDLRSRFDYIFCTGDLNMRTSLAVNDSINFLKSGKFSLVLATDEFYKCHQFNDRSPFHGFQEPTIRHGPTYRFLKGFKDNLDPFKKKTFAKDRVNTPSWCDRVLYYSRRTESVQPLSYGVNLNYTSSDHKPVFSSFMLALPTKDYLSNLSNGADTSSHQYPGYIRIEEILIKLNNRWKSVQNFQIQIQGCILNSSVISKRQHVICTKPDKMFQTSTSSKLRNLIRFLNLSDQLAILFLSPFKIILLRPGVTQRDIDTNNLFLTLLAIDNSNNRTHCIANCSIDLSKFRGDQLHSFEQDIYEHGKSIGSMIIHGCLEQISPTSNNNFHNNHHHQHQYNGFTQSPHNKTTKSIRLIDFYRSKYSSEDEIDSNSNNNILDLFNLNEYTITDCNNNFNEKHVPQSAPPNHILNKCNINKLIEPNSAFRPVQTSLEYRPTDIHNAPTHPVKHTIKPQLSGSLHQTLQHKPTTFEAVATAATSTMLLHGSTGSTSLLNTLPAINNLSGSMRLSRINHDMLQDYNERQNYSDDSCSVSHTHHHHNNSHLNHHHLHHQSTHQFSSNATTGASHNKPLLLSNNHHSSPIDCVPRHYNSMDSSHDDGDGDNDCDNHDDDDDESNIPLVAVHNEAYESTEAIRAGVTNKKRHMDARVDLSKLDQLSLVNTGSAATIQRPLQKQDDQPPLPPRNTVARTRQHQLLLHSNNNNNNTTANIRPIKTRQEHSNPISMASTGSGSSYNGLMMNGDLSAFSADASLAIPADSEFDSSIDSNADNRNNNHDMQLTPHNAPIPVNFPPVQSSTLTNNTGYHLSTTNNNTTFPLSTGQYVQAIPSGCTGGTTQQLQSQTTNPEKFIEPYASMKVGDNASYQDDMSSGNNNKSSDEQQLESNDIEYVVLQKPINLSEWMVSLSLSQQTIDRVLASDYCNIDQLLRVRESDLKLLGINDGCQRHKILVNLPLLEALHKQNKQKQQQT